MENTSNGNFVTNNSNTTAILRAGTSFKTNTQSSSSHNFHSIEISIKHTEPIALYGKPYLGARLPTPRIPPPEFMGCFRKSYFTLFQFFIIRQSWSLPKVGFLEFHFLSNKKFWRFKKKIFNYEIFSNISKNSNLGQSAYQIFAFSSFVSYENALFFHTFLLNIFFCFSTAYLWICSFFSRWLKFHIKKAKQYSCQRQTYQKQSRNTWTI